MNEQTLLSLIVLFIFLCCRFATNYYIIILFTASFFTFFLINKNFLTTNSLSQFRDIASCQTARSRRWIPWMIDRTGCTGPWALRPTNHTHPYIQTTHTLAEHNAFLHVDFWGNAISAVRPSS